MKNTLSSPFDENRLSNEWKFAKNISLDIYNGISRNALDSSNIFLRICERELNDTKSRGFSDCWQDVYRIISCVIFRLTEGFSSLRSLISYALFMCIEIDGNYVNLSACNRRDLLRNVAHFIIVDINFIVSFFIHGAHCEIKCHLLGHNVILRYLLRPDMMMEW